MPPQLVMELIDLLRDHMMGGQRRSRIPEHLQVLASLRFLAEGAYQKGVSKDYYHPMSQTMVSRCLDRVVNALVAVAPQFIKLPANAQERQQISERYESYLWPSYHYLTLQLLQVPTVQSHSRYSGLDRLLCCEIS